MATAAKSLERTCKTIVTVETLTQKLKQKAQQLGFELCGVTVAAEPKRLAAFQAWLDAGFAGSMSYFENRRQAYAHPRHVLDGCRSILMLALPYETASSRKNVSAESEVPDGLVKIARYARGEVDYHDVIHERLKILRNWLLEHAPAAAARGVVDTAPLLERELAEAAGLGWIGKNTLLLNRQWGSYFFLAALLTDLELETDQPFSRDHCGTCTACLDACPTGAFPRPFVLDARKCISYLTIEHREDVDSDLAGRLEGWLFGCDVCQEVCPWNRKSIFSREDTFEPSDNLSQLRVQDVLRMSEAEFRQRFRQTPLWRSKRRGLIRNALLLAGSRQLTELLGDITRLLEDEEPLIRRAATWALNRLQSKDPAA